MNSSLKCGKINDKRDILLIMFVICLTNKQIEAKTKLNHTKITLQVGQKKTLTVKNTKKSVTWSTNNKKIAIVSKKGAIYCRMGGISL